MNLASDEPAVEPSVRDLDRPLASDRLAAVRRLAAWRPAPPAGWNVNLHIHSFYSFNALSQSPSRIAWEAREAGLYAAGLCDFDVLDGLEEFYEAGAVLGLRAMVSLETRACLREYSQVDVNSPGEAGVIYVMGAGFARVPEASAPQGVALQALRAAAQARNLALVGRINARLGEIAVDYARDVLPLTPAGVATERHIVRAYVRRARAVFGEGPALAAFWARVLGLEPAAVEPLLNREAAFEERVRFRLVKRGGLGYEPPTPGTFPTADEFLAWVCACRAIPMMTWLDGTSEGERRPEPLIECMRAKGAAALNLIPDRNWNIADPDVRRLKMEKLREIVAVAERFGLPLCVGTEMNREGQPFFDDLAGEALRPYREAFIRGARILVGHSMLLRYADFSYVGPEAGAEFGTNLAARNAFFEKTGALPPLDEARSRALCEAGPERAFRVLWASAQRGNWMPV